MDTYLYVYVYVYTYICLYIHTYVHVSVWDHLEVLVEDEALLDRQHIMWYIRCIRDFLSLYTEEQSSERRGKILCIKVYGKS